MEHPQLPTGTRSSVRSGVSCVSIMPQAVEVACAAVCMGTFVTCAARWCLMTAELFVCAVGFCLSPVARPLKYLPSSGERNVHDIKKEMKIT